MKVLYDLFKPTTAEFKVGDYFITAMSLYPIKVDIVGPAHINNNYRKEYCSILPFTFLNNELLDDTKIEQIKKQYEEYPNTIKVVDKDDLEFILKFKIVNKNLARFYKKVKDIEFIPKSLEHIKILYESYNTR